MHIATDPRLSKWFAPLISFAKWLGKNHPTTLVRLRYFARFHKFLSLNNPQTLNEKILYLSLKTDTTLWSRCADKYEVQGYVSEKGLEDILIRQYGVYEMPDEIPFDKLPEEYLIKTTHGSGDIWFISKDNPADRESIIKYYTPILKEKYGYIEGSTHYPRIKPRLVVEAMMHNDSESEKVSKSLIDYKIWCFNGKPHWVWACCNRDDHGTDVMTYDLDWNAHPEYSIFESGYRRGVLIPKPKNFERMIEVATKLSEDFKCVRVDLYNLDGRVYFGELTFTSYGGLQDFYTDEFQKLAGSMIEL